MTSDLSIILRRGDLARFALAMRRGDEDSFIEQVRAVLVRQMAARGAKSRAAGGKRAWISVGRGNFILNQIN